MFPRLLAIAALVPLGIASEAPFQELTFDQALAAAKKDGKVVMIDFFTTWCGPCKKLDKVTWPDPGVQKWLGEKTVALRMDAEKEVVLAKRFGVEAYPTIVFVKADGTKIDQIVGFNKPDEFLKLASDALAGKTSAVRTNEKLEKSKAALAGHEDDPMARERYGDELAQAGRNEEALAEYLWCFDHGLEHSPAYAGVRVSFLLGRIGDLGKKHPPALAALKERRDDAANALLSGKGGQAEANDLAVLNRQLSTSDNTLSVFDQLKKDNRLDPQIKAAMLREIAEQLVELKRWKDLAEDPNDVVARVHREIEIINTVPKLTAETDEDSRRDMEFAARSVRSMTGKRLSAWYEALLGVGEREKADGVANDLIAFDPRGTTYATLIERALHAEAVDAARSLAERGRASLKDEDKSALEAAAKKIPAKK